MILSISLALIIERIPISRPVGPLIVPLLIACPSITKIGALLPVIDPSPRILICWFAPGVPETPTILKPETLPIRAWSGDETATPSIRSDPTTTEPDVNLFLSRDVIPVTTTSSRAVLLSNDTLTVDELPTVTFWLV